MLLKCHFRECRSIDITEFSIEILVVAHNADHRRIVRRIAELRDVNRPPITFLRIIEGITQAVVRTHATSHSHMLDARLLHGFLQFLHQDVHDGPLQRGCDILLMMLHEVRILLYPLLQRVEERCLQARETVVQPWDIRLRKCIGLRISLITFEHLSMASPAASSMVCPSTSISL